MSATATNKTSGGVLRSLRARLFKDLHRRQAKSPLNITTSPQHYVTEEPAAAVDHGLCTPQLDAIDDSTAAVDHGLCNACSSIDFQTVMSLNIQRLQIKRDGFLVAELPDAHRAPDNDCPLCLIFYQSRAFKLDGVNYQLLALSHGRASGFIRSIHRLGHIQDQICLAVVPSNRQNKAGEDFADLRGGDLAHLGVYSAGTLMITDAREKKKKKHTFAPRRITPLVDFAQIKTWLDFCSARHGLACAAVYRWSPVLGHKVIDCESLTVVLADENSPYVALSYVWGQAGSHVPMDGPRLRLSALSATIKDAITVTLRLGFRFLWVDKLCIDQEDADDKHHQINQMDRIYERADLTIIAASGAHADAGLPGVGSTARPPQPHVTIGTMTISNTMAHPYNSIPSSTWATRGWTLQEAVLSRRRLVFTPAQVYFECNTMNVTETIDVVLDEIHTKDMRTMQPYLHSGMFSGRKGIPQLYQIGVTARFERYTALVEEYSTRTLSFEEDILKAFAGIMNYLTQHNEGKIRQISGIPFYVHQPLESFATSLLWRRDDVDLERRLADTEQLPSWSWAGWKGYVYFQITPDLKPYKLHLAFSCPDGDYCVCDGSSTRIDKHTSTPSVLTALDVAAHFLAPSYFKPPRDHFPKGHVLATANAELNFDNERDSLENAFEKLSDGSYVLMIVGTELGSTNVNPGNDISELSDESDEQVPHGEYLFEHRLLNPNRDQFPSGSDAYQGNAVVHCLILQKENKKEDNRTVSRIGVAELTVRWNSTIDVLDREFTNGLRSATFRIV